MTASQVRSKGSFYLVLPSSTHSFHLMVHAGCSRNCHHNCIAAIKRRKRKGNACVFLLKAPIFQWPRLVIRETRKHNLKVITIEKGEWTMQGQLGVLYTLNSTVWGLCDFYSHINILYSRARCQWLTPVILVTCEAEIGRIVVQGQSKQKVSKTPAQPIVGCSGTCLSSQAMWKTEIRTITVSGQPGQKSW
jgi:hypothetical protein